MIGNYQLQKKKTRKKISVWVLGIYYVWSEFWLHNTQVHKNNDNN